MKEEKCPHCKFFDRLNNDLEEMHVDVSGKSKDSTTAYYIMTELFVYIHDGKDYCNWYELSING